MRHSAELGTVNSTELRCCGIEMETASGAIKPIIIRRSKRANAQVQAMAIQSESQQSRPVEYTLPIDSEAVILNNCW